MTEHDPLYGWEANRRRKLVLGLDATPEQRLDWLEWEIRGVYTNEGGEPGQLTLRLVEKSYG